MLNRLRHPQNENAFTLIELLVVILIIGILAAIAVPVFLNQQKAAINASLKSDVHNTQLNAVTFMTERTFTSADNNVYGTGTSGERFSFATTNPTPTLVISDKETTMAVKFFGDGNYKVEGYNPNAAKVYNYDSATGKYGAVNANIAAPVSPDKGASLKDGSQVAEPANPSTTTPTTEPTTPPASTTPPAEAAPVPDPNGPVMVSMWNTKIAGCSTVTLPISGAQGGTVEWGDGSPVTKLTDKATHTYSVQSPVAIKITGKFDRWGSIASGWTPNCITQVTEWGETGTTSMQSAFSGAKNLTQVPANIPSTVTNIQAAFAGATIFNDPNVSKWNTSNVTNMTSVFHTASSFNQPLNSWNTSNVTAINSMFYEAVAFNQPLNNWNTSKVTTLNNSFRGASSFNQPLSSWNTAAVTDMYATFYSAKGFKQNVSTWNTSKVTTYEFFYAESGLTSAQVPAKVR